MGGYQTHRLEVCVCTEGGVGCLNVLVYRGVCSERAGITRSPLPCTSPHTAHTHTLHIHTHTKSLSQISHTNLTHTRMGATHRGAHCALRARSASMLFSAKAASGPIFRVALPPMTPPPMVAPPFIVAPCEPLPIPPGP